MGPSTSRIPNQLTAPQPSLTQPGLNVLQSIFGGQGMGGQGTPMQQQGVGRGMSQVVNRPSPMGGGYGAPQGGAPGNFFQNLQSAFGSPFSPGISNTLNQFATGPNPGQGVVGAYAPIFQRNLATAMDTGPRFSSGNNMLRTQAMNDYNMFAQQALLGGQQQQIGAALGFGGLQQQGQQALMQQLLSTLFQGGGMTTPAAINVRPGLGQQLLGAAGTAGGFALGGPMGAAAGGAFGNALGGGGSTDLTMGGTYGAVDPSQIPMFAGGTGYGG